ncbi:hypothetical protein D3C87_1812560 [compost metagenome]
MILSLELLDNFITLSLRQERRNRHRRNAVVHEELRDLLNIHFEVCEDDGLLWILSLQ